MSDASWITAVLNDLIDFLDEDEQALTREHLIRAAQSLEPAELLRQRPLQPLAEQTILH